MRLNTFEQVKAKYEDTKPINSSITSKELDVRPLAVNRSRRAERVVKISDTCYVLTDSYSMWNNLYSSETYPATPPEIVKSLALIVWEKQTDGRVYVTLTNPVYERCRISGARKRFMRTYLPTGLTLIQKGNDYMIDNGDRQYFLPKRYIETNYNKASGCIGDVITRDTGEQLVFEQSPSYSKFTLVGGDFSRTLIRVDKSTKEKYKGEINTFVSWMLTMAPLLRPEASGDYRQRILKYRIGEKLIDVLEAHFHESVPRRTLMDRAIQDGLFREVIKQDDHPLRVVFSEYILAQVDYWELDRVTVPYKIFMWSTPNRREERTMPPIGPEQFAVEMKRLKNRINQLVNKVCNFTIEVAEGE